MAEQLTTLSREILNDLGNLRKIANNDTLQEKIDEVESKVKYLEVQLYLIKSEKKEINPSDVGLKKDHKLQLIGKGEFGSVFKSTYLGVAVAIKLLKSSKGKFQEEMIVLRSLLHDNIIAFRGNGIFQDQLFIVMEYLKEDLMTYIKNSNSHDGSGLSAFQTWHICHQVANGMLYLHSKNIAHRDLKPDNILLDTSPVNPVAKLCDFGLACLDINAKKTWIGDARYKAPDKIKGENPAAMFEGLKKADVFCFGLVVLVARTGKRPWPGETTNELEGKFHEVKVISSTTLYVGDIKVSDSDVGGDIGKAIRACLSDPPNRPLFDQIVTEYIPKENPFKLKEFKGEFFSCGFLTNTYIYVVDSIVPEDDTKASNSTKPTYEKENLMCQVSMETLENLPDNDQKTFDAYATNLEKYQKMAEDKVIDNNTTIALKEIILDREGPEEGQHIKLSFKISNYCHHRAMRDIWRSFDETEKNQLVPCKTDVNTLYSNSFGLHIAILTNEKDGKSKFIFTQRSTQKGVASPGKFTCGAVESCSEKDYVKPVRNSDFNQVSLLATAARGLDEEVGLLLTGSDLDAIHLNTVYLKFDNHEWGMCGFVDLRDEKIQEKHRFDFKALETAFTTGPKDRFEHSRIVGVDFELPTMVNWIREHHNDLASSAKIVVVKVLQAYFGTPMVNIEFAKHTPA